MTRISLFEKMEVWFFLAPMAPMCAISTISRNLFTTLRFRQIQRRSTNPELGPDFLQRTRIVANTYVGLGLRPSTMLPPAAYVIWCDRVKKNKVFDALTFGQKTDENSCLIELTEEGKLALLESSILPNYKQLRFLDSRSSIATFIISVQAIGYVISIVVRTSLHLAVTPIEVIASAYSVLVIVHCIVHTVAMLCQNSLVIYLNPEQEQELSEKCASTRWSEVDTANCGWAEFVGVFGVWSMVVAFTILVARHLFTISMLQYSGLLVFLLSLTVQLFINKRLFSSSKEDEITHESCAIVSLAGILISLVATVVDWKTHNFDSRTPSLIHITPFLG